MLLSDASCWCQNSDCVTWKLPVIAVLNRVFCWLSQQPGKGLNGQKKMECPVSQQSSLIPEKPCVSGSVKHGVGRGGLLLFHICYPCGLSTVEAFICCRGQTGVSLAVPTYKREHMNCSFISHPSCLC